jgi:hypothetical protein
MDAGGEYKLPGQRKGSLLLIAKAVTILLTFSLVL